MTVLLSGLLPVRENGLIINRPWKVIRDLAVKDNPDSSAGIPHHLRQSRVKGPALPPLMPWYAVFPVIAKMQLI